MTKMRLGLLVAALAGLSMGAVAAEKQLMVGDPAPKLQVAKWVQGEPVTGFEKDKAYIVEFWATWCGPCRTTIPHLNEVHKKFKDKGLVVIGQDVWEQDEAEVPKFVKQMGEKMTYRVALDDKKGSEKGKMAETWMEAAGQSGIPSAFVVDKTGHIVWIGHPMSLKEKFLEDVLAGKVDAKKAAEDYAKQQANEEKVNAAFRDFRKAAEAKEWQKADARLSEVEQLLDAEERENIDMWRLRLNFMKEDMKAAETVAKRLVERESEDAAYHNQLSWTIATQKGASKELIALAEKSAIKANDLSKGSDAAILDTLARVQFVKGEKEAAIATQEKALKALSPDDRARKQYEKTLQAYKDGKVPDDN